MQCCIIQRTGVDSILCYWEEEMTSAKLPISPVRWIMTNRSLHAFDPGRPCVKFKIGLIKWPIPPLAQHVLIYYPDGFETMDNLLEPANRIGFAHDILRMKPRYFANEFWCFFLNPRYFANGSHFEPTLFCEWVSIKIVLTVLSRGVI